MDGLERPKHKIKVMWIQRQKRGFYSLAPSSYYGGYYVFHESVGKGFRIS